MGCAPSLQVSSAGVLSSREDEEDQEQLHTNANHQALSTSVTPTTTTTTTAVLSAGCNQRQGPRSQHQVSQSWEAPGHPLRVLLVFGREDSVCNAWRTATNRQGHHVTLAHTQEQAVAAYGEQTHDVVVIDARAARGYQAGGICAAIRQCEGGHQAVCVGVVKRSFADKENATVGPLLKAGFNRVLTESSSVGSILNDLIQIESSEISSQVQVCASKAVLCALDTCRELVHITDAHHRIKYINKATENVLGYTLEEVVDKSLWDIHTPHSTSSTSAANTTSASATSSATDHHRPSLEFRQPPQSDHHAGNLKTVDGKVASDIPEPVNQAVRRGREWEGVVACRRRSGGTLHLPSKVIPVGPMASRRNQFYVYLSDTHTPDAHPLDLHHFHHHHHHPRGSIKSLRKGSHSHDLRALTADGGGVVGGGTTTSATTNPQTGSIIRRQSLVKLHSLTIEAPITRVFSIIAAAQDNSPAYVAQALEKAVEILRSTELYSPQLMPSVGGGTGVGTGDGMAGVRAMVPAADPVATDLLGGLLAQGPKPLLSGRRSSNDTTVGGASLGSAGGGGKVPQPPAALTRPSLSALNQQASSAIRELLAEDLMWSFDIFKLERISDKKPLVWLGMSLMCKFDVPATLGCDETTLQNWLTLIEANYHSDNSYHNSTHAADVLQSTAYFLNRERMRQLFDPLDIVAALVAAVVHDVDHPGKNSAFLCNTNNELAVLYNDLSVLESHHVAVSFKHTRSDDRVNIFKALDRDTYKHVRKSIIDMVLATDMTKHFEHLSKFINMAGAASTSLPPPSGVEGGADGDDGGGEGTNGVFEEDDLGPHADLLAFGSPENMVIIKRMLIKCADVSNPLRPLHLSIDWAYRIANEYFNQTEEEKERSLPIVMPQFDRTTCSIPKSQIGFIDFFINDMFDAWDALADIPELLDHLRNNYLYWKEQEEAGVTAPPPPPPSPPQPPPSPPPPPPNGEKIHAPEEEEEEEEEEKKEVIEEEEEEEEAKKEEES